jgi:hypothetical protein
MAHTTIDLNRSAASGSYIVGKIVCDATADYNQNNSDLTCRLYVRKANDGTQLTIPTSGTWSYIVTVNGRPFSGTVSKDVLLDWVLIATVTVSDIAHNDEGIQGITITGSVTAPAGTSFAGHTTSGSGDFTLDRIPRASVISSATDVSIGYQSVVRWIPASASFRYRLRFSMGNWNHTTDAIHPNRTTEYTYTEYVIPMEVANQIPNTRIGTMTVTLFTYSDSGAASQIGSADSKTFLVILPDNSDTKPKVSMMLSPVGALPSAFAGLYIQGLTKVKATLSAEGKYGASIASYMMKVDGVFHDLDDAYTSRYLADAGRKTVYGYATDYRGHTGENIQTIDVIPYSIPKLDGASAVRCDENGNPNESGTYLKISAKRIYSPVVVAGVQKNFCAIQYKYLSDGVTWSNWATLLDPKNIGSDEVITGPLLGGLLESKKTYVVHLMAIDSIGRYAESFITIPTEKIYMHRDGARNSIGLGKYNTRDNAVDSDWDFYMNNHRITGLPSPSSDSDAVPKSYAQPADVKLINYPSAMGWYKIGTVTGDMCSVNTITIGGIFQNNQASPAVVDIATQYGSARIIKRLSSLTDNQISRVGIIAEDYVTYGVYVYYNSAKLNPVLFNIHSHMGKFTPQEWGISNVSDSNMLAVVTLKE